ncbi:hypothetical protein GGR53DRAFT_513554 [Hypoxylon sp. FL1150]|nr:hypothetical protein GGR53DRAFT_513554 [Hypoxylon sp. FL1150]
MICLMLFKTLADVLFLHSVLFICVDHPVSQWPSCRSLIAVLPRPKTDLSSCTYPMSHTKETEMAVSNKTTRPFERTHSLTESNTPAAEPLQICQKKQERERERIESSGESNPLPDLKVISVRRYPGPVCIRLCTDARETSFSSPSILRAWHIPSRNILISYTLGNRIGEHCDPSEDWI